jgi:putative endonuclease
MSVSGPKMYYVYILENEAGSHYIGYTSDLSKRIKGHNSSKSRWTRKKGPWHLVHREEYPTKEEAFLRERQIKRYKGGRAFKLLLAKNLNSG